MERPVIIRLEAFAIPIRRVVQRHPVDLAAVLHLKQPGNYSCWSLRTVVAGGHGCPASHAVSGPGWLSAWASSQKGV